MSFKAAFSLGGGIKKAKPKLGFGIAKQTKLKVPVAFAADSDDDNAGVNGSESANTPSDPEVTKVADKLAQFVATNGRSFEGITKERNPGNTPFRFLFDTDCADYKYYERKIAEFSVGLTGGQPSDAAANSSVPLVNGSHEETAPPPLPPSAPQPPAKSACQPPVAHMPPPAYPPHQTAWQQPPPMHQHPHQHQHQHPQQDSLQGPAAPGQHTWQGHHQHLPQQHCPPPQDHPMAQQPWQQQNNLQLPQNPQQQQPQHSQYHEPHHKQQPWQHEQQLQQPWQQQQQQQQILPPTSGQQWPHPQQNFHSGGGQLWPQPPQHHQHHQQHQQHQLYQPGAPHPPAPPPPVPHPAGPSPPAPPQPAPHPPPFVAHQQQQGQPHHQSQQVQHMQSNSQPQTNHMLTPQQPVVSPPRLQDPPALQQPASVPAEAAPSAPHPESLPEPAAETDAAVETAKAAAGAETDSVAAMEKFTQMAAERDAQRDAKQTKVELLNETSFDRRRQVTVTKKDGSRGHHVNDYIPDDEMAKFMSKANDPQSKAAAAALEEKARIQSDNIGHRLLSKMGWKEGQGLGASNDGIAAPVAASGASSGSGVKLGLGTQEHGTVAEGDDAFETYRKRMMLGYKHRPNPLGNPRKSYYNK